MLTRSEMIIIIKWVAKEGLERYYNKEIAYDYNQETFDDKLEALVDEGHEYDWSYLERFGLEEYFREYKLEFLLLKPLYDNRFGDECNPWRNLNKDFMDHFYSNLKDDFYWIGDVENYISEGYFITKDEERKEIDARAVIYRACSKAYWNPHCKIGRKMAENRYNKMLEIGSESEDDDCEDTEICCGGCNGEICSECPVDNSLNH